jgi:hypothetical protein
MDNASSWEYSELEEQAMLIAGEIFNLTNQYTHDSNVAKFFLSDEIAKACYALAGGFTSVVYTKPLPPNTIEDEPLLPFLYALMTYGFNIYLRERSLLTNSSPYILPTERRFIKKVQKETLEITSEGNLLSTPLTDKIISIIIENIRSQIDLQEFQTKGHRFNKTKFWEYTKLSLYWGYNFAKYLLERKKRKVNKKN